MADTLEKEKPHHGIPPSDDDDVSRITPDNINEETKIPNGNSDGMPQPHTEQSDTNNNKSQKYDKSV